VADPTSPIERVVVIMPTYEERQNLEAITGRLRAAVPEADLLVVDDNSPDGTGDLADKLAEADSHIQVMHRTGKAGLGAAYIAGFRTGRTSPNCSRSCLPRWPAPTPSSDPGGCPAGRW
jgi:dolichol-phosphate mannosyltransferase